MVKCSFLDEKFVYRSFYDAPFTFSYFFTSRKNSVFRTRHQVACEMFICLKCLEHPVEKILSLVLFDSNCSFKTVKCSFFNQVIILFIKVSMVRRSCLIMFYFKENFCVLARVGKSLVRCLSN